MEKNGIKPCYGLLNGSAIQMAEVRSSFITTTHWRFITLINLQYTMPYLLAILSGQDEVQPYAKQRAAQAHSFTGPVAASPPHQGPRTRRADPGLPSARRHGGGQPRAPALRPPAPTRGLRGSSTAGMAALAAWLPCVAARLAQAGMASTGAGRVSVPGDVRLRRACRCCGACGCGPACRDARLALLTPDGQGSGAAPRRRRAARALRVGARAGWAARGRLARQVRTRVPRRQARRAAPCTPAGERQNRPGRDAAALGSACPPSVRPARGRLVLGSRREETAPSQ